RKTPCAVRIGGIASQTANRKKQGWGMLRNALGFSALPALGIALCLGCSGPASTPAKSAANQDHSQTNSRVDEADMTANKPPATWSADEVLRKLIDTYRAARTYQDQGIVRLAYRQAGQPVGQEWPVAVAFERPAKLSLVAYQATVKCDGKELKAQIKDD